MSKTWSFKKTGQSYLQKFIFSDNHGKNIRKSNQQNWTRQEKFDIYFLRVFWLPLPKFNFWKGGWALDPTQIWGFSNI